VLQKSRFFMLLNDPEKHIKVLSIIRSHVFYEPKKVNAHGLSNFIDSGKNLRKTHIVRSRGFNEPKKVNAHGLSNFRESGKNLRKTPGWLFFVVSPYGPKKS
jgi:G3E family GTPase